MTNPNRLKAELQTNVLIAWVSQASNAAASLKVRW
jgi:hypothetical protein